jgi:hypothetical protein
MRERQREKEERREIEEIKTEIRPFQFQTTITFDKLTLMSLLSFLGQKNLIFKLKKTFEVFFSVFS